MTTAKIKYHKHRRELSERNGFSTYAISFFYEFMEFW